MKEINVNLPSYTKNEPAPSISLPKGGGAIKTIDEKFQVNAANGTAGCTIGLPFSPSRNGFMPSLSLNYNSGSGNSAFGLGWHAEPPAIVRKTDKKLPEYNDADESDIFMISGAEDLVPVFNKEASGNWTKDNRIVNGNTITRYRPRIEGGYERIEKITDASGHVYWKVTSPANIVSIFGKSKTAQVTDPADPNRIYKWLLEFSYDDKGNCFQAEYKQEDKINVPNELHEKNRLNDIAAFTNTYVKRIKYCNKTHFNRASIDLTNWDAFLQSIDYLMELILDYGEHDVADPQPGDDKGWLCRKDPFSAYYAGFEIRTYRLCRRILMFHRFSELGSTPCLIRSADFDYREGTAITFLNSVTYKGYIRQSPGSYSQKAMPPFEFGYAPLAWNTEVRSLPPGATDNLPFGIDNYYYQWVDLYREGISGILTEQDNGWFYKSNAGNGHLEAAQLVQQKPSLHGLTGGGVQLQDVEGSGQTFLVSNEFKGYFELDNNNDWQPFQHFSTLPNIILQDPNLKYIDLNGDGMPDILISEDEVFSWYASKGQSGFDDHRSAPKEMDEEKGPAIVFADSTHSIVLADMSGDGLMDIVRIRYSEVVYWPNLGYGRFGAKVNMSNAPVFDLPENFDPRLVKLADIDGSGSTDIIYLGNDSFKIYFNQGGNSWSDENSIEGINPLPFPKIDGYSSVSMVDLLGNGTGCIVWSSPLPQHAGNPLRYIDLMNGKKPHVLTSYKNNMGKEVAVEYLPSTFFYLQDKKAGTPWITRLPFPVPCVSKVIYSDKITKTRFTSQYSYHHGYYDQPEREFRGFGRVEQTDTENFELFKKLSDPSDSIQIIDEGFHQPPVLTKTWFHTGAFLDREKILTQFAHEYYSNTVIPENELMDPVLPPDLTVEEWREALRACKGITLRTEVYTPDGSDQQQHPYTTSHASCLLQLLQPRLENPYSVFIVQGSETLAYTYERNPADPRIAHTMTLEVDEFGNVLKAASINYGRKTTDPSLPLFAQGEQAKTHIIFTGATFTNKIDADTDYRLPLNYETSAYELTGFAPGTGDYFTAEEIRNGFNEATPIAYEAKAAGTIKEKRLIGQGRIVFLKNSLDGPLPSGVMESLALPYQSCRLALTPGVKEFIYGNKVSDALLTDEGKYVHNEDDNFWISSGTQVYDAANFYLVTEVTDPFGIKDQLHYDSAYHFYIQQTIDALENKTTITGFNFRTLSPWLVVDMNDNRNGIRMDELGMVTASFVMGKENEQKGDPIDTASVEASVNDKPTSTLEYDLFRYLQTGKPVVALSKTRETHYYDSLLSGRESTWQTSYTYYDGNGQTVMQKMQAEPGIALQENADGTVTEVDTTPELRWVGNGRTILNNKGKPVKAYEPYFSTTFEFEDASQLVERGVSPIIQYDSAGRVIRTYLPGGTFTKTEYNSWMQQTFDPNDTVLESQWYKDRITEPKQEVATPEEIAAANKAAAHANTPATAYFDSLGRTFISVADNGSAGKYTVITVFDIRGNVLSITDAAGNVVVQNRYDIPGAQLYSRNMDGGERWVVNDITGKALRSYDSRNNIFRHVYDALRRPAAVFLQQPAIAEINLEKTIYGETAPDAGLNNLRGKPYRHYDASGLSTSVQFDFKGNSLHGTKQLLKDYKHTADWNLLGEGDLETTIFTTSGSFDALNRPVQTQAPDGSLIRPVYDEAGKLNEVYVSIQGASEKQFVRSISYDAKGQRQHIVYGNNTRTGYEYDLQTLRLKRLTTSVQGQATDLRDIVYTYDPTGNISFVKDNAQADVFFDNAVVKAENDFIYDAIYRLIQASGREHAGQNKLNETGSNNNFRDFPFENSADPDNAQALRNYTQKYEYDAAGNIRQLQHIAGTDSFTRTCQYNNNDADRQAAGISSDEIKNNRLLTTTVGGVTTRYQYDVHGNMLSLPHLQNLVWNYKEVLQQIDLGGGGTAWYVYDGGGQRIRKVIERPDGSVTERIYLGSFELYRKIAGDGTIKEETGTLHIPDDAGEIAIVETKTIEESVVIPATELKPLIRFQYGNHQGSASLELDENGVMISYEEYHPYGTSSFQLTNKDIQSAYKRYRYTGMERDEESGLEYHSARYYLPWLGRWLSPDPIGIQGGMNLYEYVQDNPVMATDREGKQPDFDDFNRFADTNRDGVINQKELDAALQSSKITQYEWDMHMVNNPGGKYKLDKTVANRIADTYFKFKPENLPPAADLAESYKRNYGTYFGDDGRAYSSTAEQRDKWADDLNHPSRAAKKNLETTVYVAATLEFPIITSAATLGYGVYKNDDELIGQGVVGLVAGGAFKLAGGGGGVAGKIATEAAETESTVVGKTVTGSSSGLGKYYEKPKWGLKWLRKRARVHGDAAPYGTPGKELRHGSAGVTNPDGQIYISPILSPEDELIARGHEGGHRILMPMGSDAVSTLRRKAGNWLYNKLSVYKLSEEFLVHSIGTGSWKEGLLHLEKFAYQPAGIGYNLNPWGVRLGVAGLALTYAGAVYLGYQLSSFLGN